MNVYVVYTTFVVLIHMEVFIWAQLPCTPWIYNTDFQKCYRKYCDNRNFEDAQKVCEQQGGNLVTICSEAENNFVAFMSRVANGYPDGTLMRTWIGMRRNPNNRNQLQWMSGSSCSYSNWYPGEPNDDDGVETYIHLYTEWEQYWKLWNDQRAMNCHYICERSTCPQEDVE